MAPPKRKLLPRKGNNRAADPEPDISEQETSEDETSEPQNHEDGGDGQPDAEQAATADTQGGTAEDQDEESGDGEVSMSEEEKERALAAADTKKRNDALATILQNWRTINRLEDMIAPQTWFRGVTNRGTGNVTWDTSTLEAAARLSQATTNEEEFVRRRIEIRWGDRQRNHGEFKRRAVGTNWALKEPNLRADLEWLGRQAGGLEWNQWMKKWKKEKEAEAEKKRKEEEERRRRQAPPGRSSRQPNLASSSHRTTRSQAPTTHGNTVNATRANTRQADAAKKRAKSTNEASTAQPPRKKSRTNKNEPSQPPAPLVSQRPRPWPPLIDYETSLSLVPHPRANPTTPSPPETQLTGRIPSPAWSDKTGPSADDLPNMRRRLQRYWNLPAEDCRDAIPRNLRPDWRGSINGWGSYDAGVALRLLCNLACMTRNRHAEVVERFRRIVERRGGRGLDVPDLREAYAWFSRGGVQRLPERSANRDDDTNQTRQPAPATQRPAPSAQSLPQTVGDAVQALHRANMELRAAERALREAREGARNNPLATAVDTLHADDAVAQAQQRIANAKVDQDRLLRVIQELRRAEGRG